LTSYLNVRTAIEHFANAPTDFLSRAIAARQLVSEETQPLLDELESAAEILSLWSKGRTQWFEGNLKILCERRESGWKASVVRLAALVGCGLGASAYIWSCNKLTTVLVRVADRRYLALVPNSVMAEIDLWKFMLVQKESVYRGTVETWCLIAGQTIREDVHYRVCLFPLTLKIGWEAKFKDRFKLHG
jgi:hypothetical protein